MANSRIVYRGWLTEATEDPSASLFVSLDSPQAASLTTDHLALSPEERDRAVTLEQAVREALLRLTDSEREVIERFYFHAEEYKQMSLRLRRTISHLVALHDRALRRLRKELRPLARECLGIPIEQSMACALCHSPHRPRIDHILATRDRTHPWSVTIRRLKQELGLAVNNPQLLIGHEKYH